jgi:hypothetical protein
VLRKGNERPSRRELTAPPGTSSRLEVGYAERKQGDEIFGVVAVSLLA